MIIHEKTEVLIEEICPVDTLSTTHRTWVAMGLNPDLYFEKSMTKHLSYGMAPTDNFT
jgi:hypothetical protein